MKIKNLSKVKGFEEYNDYSITSDGEVISHHKEEDKILKSADIGNGYLQVHLCNHSNKKKIYIHRIVLMAFCKGYKDDLECNHKDENKSNNNYKNLEWITHKQNMNYGTRRKRQIKGASKPVAQLTLEGKLIKKWESATEAQRKGNFDRSSISRACLGKLKTSGGFKWRFTY